MLVKLDEEVVYEIDERMFKMISDYVDINIDPKEDIKRRLFYIIKHLCDQIYINLCDEWVKPDESGQSKLAKSGIDSIPTSKTGIIDVILKHPNYINREKRKIIAQENIEEEKRRLKEKEENAKKLQEEKVVPIESEK